MSAVDINTLPEVTDPAEIRNLRLVGWQTVGATSPAQVVLDGTAKPRTLPMTNMVLTEDIEAQA